MRITGRKEMTDEQLVQGCIQNEAAAQRKLYDKYARKMFGVCLRYAGSREEAEDFLQEGFVKIFQKISSFKHEGSLEGWIRRIMVNCALDHLRQQKLNWSGNEPEDNRQAEEVTLDRINAQDLLNLIGELPKGFRTVFNLYAIEGYNHREIGEMLGISENTSKSQYSRARAQLAEKVNLLNLTVITAVTTG